MYHVWVVLICSSHLVLTQHNEENDTCNLATGQKGVCKPLSKCPYAQNLLRDGKRPENCGFSVWEPIVCCAIEVKKTGPKLNLLLVSNSSRVTPSAETPGELSRKKCIFFYPKPMYPSLVTGGTPSLAREFPHMAIIGFGEKNKIQWQCGGSLISHNFVITAAHCLNSNDLGPARWVRLGDLDIESDTDDADPQDFTVKMSVAHPLYRAPLRYHDIALIELDRKVALSAYVSPACLHTERVLKQNTMTATGWGKTKFTGNSSSFLLKVDLAHIPNDKCATSFNNAPSNVLPNGIVDDWQVCAGGVIGQDTCQGDSGGPLQIKNNDRTFFVRVHTLIGIISFGKPCGLSKSPAVYTRVSNYIHWIESTIWPNENATTVDKAVEFRPIN